MATNLSFFHPLDKPRDVLIEDAGFALTSHGVLRHVSILISGRKIVAIGGRESIRDRFSAPEEVIDGRNCLVMPGFINNHSHIAMALLRGLAEDLPLLNWLRDRVWPIEAKLKPWQIEVGASIGAAECLLSGTTTVNSNYLYDDAGSEASAIEAIGMRGVVSHGVFDWTEDTALRTTERLATNFHGKDNGRIRVATSPHSAYSCSPALLKKIEELRSVLNGRLGEEYPVLSAIHAAESKYESKEIETRYGTDARSGVVSYLHSLGVLNSETVVAHAIHLTSEDYSAFIETGASIASCPISNLKVGAGVADLPKAISKNIVVSLGTDGPASNNTLDMFETTKIASLLAKGVQMDPALLGARQSFGLATEGGAKSLHLEALTGVLEEGYAADVVLLDLSGISSIPFFDPYNYVIFSAQPRDVKHVIVDGRVLVRDGRIHGLDMTRLSERVTSAVDEIAA